MAVTDFMPGNHVARDQRPVAAYIEIFLRYYPLWVAVRIYDFSGVIMAICSGRPHRHAAPCSFGASEAGQRRENTRLRSMALLLAGVAASCGAQAAGQVSSIQTSLVPATPFTYTAKGIEYQWGMGSNQIMEGFTSDGRQFSYALAADRVELRRDDIPGVTTGEPCGIFVERLSDGEASRQFAADYPSDGSATGNCDIPAMLASRVLNRGAVDLFSNKLPDAKNIERLDYVFDYGVLAPFDQNAMGLAGHVASEKSSNNPVKMAAILELDMLGQPAAYGPMMLVGANGCVEPALCYGVTDLQHTYSFLQNEYNEPHSYPAETERSFESVGMAFVSTASLGLNPGQRYYGFSFFADDVNAEDHNLLDPASFPDDTSDDYIVPGDDADIYGGLSGYFVADELNVTSGAVFNDVNEDGVRQPNEAGISDIGITLYVDADGNGVLDVGVDAPVGDPIDSDMSGNFVLPGIPDGNYLVVMDESDPELPPGLVAAPGTNPHPLMVAGGDTEPVYFPFIDANGSNGSVDSGSTDGTATGTGDAGTDGGTDSGTADSGTDGGTDSGTADSGTDGGTDSGTGDAGTDGGTDSGTADSGTDGGTTTGTGDGGTDGGTPIDDSTTDAIDDEFEVNQGRSATLDVLLNDVDGAGLGLTLITVSESPNSTITIVDNMLDYRPDYGFYGADTFFYVMEDADGTRSTGNVLVTVIRYSDLNDNQQNDFIECGCDNLTLETGVHGSGIGSLSLFTAWILLTVAAWRRRARARATALQAERGVS
ncbi:MAG: hypothetical protein HKN42_15165 [Granulosicoccus sp.]|nr:hypothetical protein [Granulosicoccus sp.]